MVEKMTLNAEEVHLDPLGEIAFLPDNLFFYKSMDLVENLSKNRLEEWVYNAIVESAPFPIDQLLWGFVTRTNAKGVEQVLWYAGLKERILSVIGAFDEHLHPIPYFALAFLLSTKGAQIFTDGKFASVCVDGQIFNFYKAEEASFTHVHQCLLDAHKLIDENLMQIKLIGTKRNYAGDVKLTLEYHLLDESVKQREVNLSANVIWWADVRDKSLLKSLKRQQQLAEYSQVGFKAACVFFIFLFAFECCLLGAKACLMYKESVKNKLQAKALSIESKDFLVRKIQGTVEQEIRPFELLGIMNNFRPQSIYFLSALVDNLHNVVIEAMAETAVSAEDYRQQLANSGYFESVSIENITTTYQGTKFTLLCDFKERKPTSFLTLENPS